MTDDVLVEEAGLRKVLDVLQQNETFHRRRDEMNGAVHLAREVRLSPLTSETAAARERVEEWLGHTATPPMPTRSA